MTLYEKKSFTVPASGEKSPAHCQHGWVYANRCVLCGTTVMEDDFRWSRESYDELKGRVTQGGGGTVTATFTPGTPCE